MKNTGIDFLQEELFIRGVDSLNLVSKADAADLLIVDANFKDWPKGMKPLLTKYPLPGKADSYRVLSHDGQVYIQGRDFRGTLFGIGFFLRKVNFTQGLEWKGHSTSVQPYKDIRGHQLGYRNTANSYDAWTVDEYEQYIKDLIVFGSNAVEIIPFHEDSPIHFTLSNWDMNIEISKICNKYNLDYWMWAPIQFDLNDGEKSEAYLQKADSFYRELPRLDAIFVPGGDPGSNPPELVLPMMKKMADLAQKYHPHAKLWLSMQGFKPEETQYVYDFLDEDHTAWMDGLVAGPSSPPMSETRAAIASEYKLRHYPDITHTVRCQYPNWWWDPVFNFTLGREPVNPQPLRYQNIFLHTADYTDGFITYSDGMHDDLNKMIWSGLGMERESDILELVRDYANYFIDSQQSDDIADALMALETNWDGAAKYNGSINSTLALFEAINERGQLDEVWEAWRWKMYLMRAYYDAFQRKRFIYEEKLEGQANEVMMKSGTLSSEVVIDSVYHILEKSKKKFKKDPWRNKIYHLGDDLFEVIGYQPSVPLYQARNPERSGVIEFIDRPLNNKWWIEDEFEKMAEWKEADKIARLKTIGSWENPGPGSFYDDIGNIYKSNHVVKITAPQNDALLELSENPGFDWWESGYSKARLAWMINMNWPKAMKYGGLDINAQYSIRMTGVGQIQTIADGEELKFIEERIKTGEVVEISVPKKLTADGKLTITWKELEESHLNWRYQSRLNEVWLIKN
ncbi:hypothetical protein GCM10025777_53720 [Membranihabitans marinus]